MLSPNCFHWIGFAVVRFVGPLLLMFEDSHSRLLLHFTCGIL